MKKTTKAAAAKVNARVEALRIKMDSLEIGSSHYNALQTLSILFNEADKGTGTITYAGEFNNMIYISDIPSLAMEYGMDFDREGMRRKLSGLQARYQDCGISVLITHDLNSAKLENLSKLMYEIRQR